MIRDYELHGLLSPCRCTSNGYRIYDEQVLQRLQFVLAGKAARISLNALAELCQAMDNEAIAAHFDELCQTKTSFATLNQALKRMASNKSELLLVLQRPDIPLHNNLSEGDIREYVIKRKISGSTRSENGRRCRDTFASLKKTCKKQGISFWEFLTDRLRQQQLIPYLPDLLADKVSLLKTL